MTEERPLLSFGAPIPGAIPAVQGRPFPPTPRTPSRERQGQRLAPQFAAISSALTAGRSEITETTLEPNPELVVVFDLAGTVDNFMRAVSGVEGLEFLAEIAEESVEADDEFFYEDDGVPNDNLVPEVLYMVMSNARASIELISLFEGWKNDENMAFPRGLAPLKNAFRLLRSIRRWGPEDRVRETHLLEAWTEDVATAGAQGFARIEIELWFRDDANVRQSNQSSIQGLIAEIGGNIITVASIPSIDYHAILADVPYSQVATVLEKGLDSISLLTTESVMFVSPARPMSVPYLLTENNSELPENLGEPSTRPPRVALLDGVPQANHTALVGRLILDDPDGLSMNYTNGKHNHGTAMASLILHGDLNTIGPALSTKVYLRPIMEPHAFLDREVIATNDLLVDLIHRAFHRMFRGDGDGAAVAPSVRIVNLSIGDPARVFARRLSPLAKLLDWLAHNFNLVILVSAGNHEVSPVIDSQSLADQNSLRKAVLESNHGTARHRRLLSPAEAVNVLTVGALHSDSTTGAFPDTVIDVTQDGMPALYSATGFGYRNSVKPEILLPGGKQVFGSPLANSQGSVTLSPVQSPSIGPGLLVAAPSQTGSTSKTAFSVGTSNATALGSRAANFIFDVLESATNEPDEFPFPDPQYHPVLAKTLLVHAASWGTNSSIIRGALELNPRNPRRDLTQLLGYGPVDVNRVAQASRTRAVLIGAGSIGADQRQTFYFPLPPSLQATTEWRRLTITLGWLSPVNVRSQKHRMARLFFEQPSEHIGVQRVEADSKAVRKGTVQHEIFEGAAAVAFVNNGVLTINVDCRVDAGRLGAAVRFGLAASLEMGVSVQADIHAEVRQLLKVQLRNRIAERTRL